MPERGRRALQVAWELFGSRGYASTSIRDVALASGQELEDVFRLFPHKQDLVFELYHHLALQLEERLPELSEDTLARRFAAVMDTKIALLKPYRATLEGVFETMLDPGQDLGVWSAHMELIRRRVRGVFRYVALGATDRPPPGALEATVRNLYRLHLALAFLWLRQPRLYPAARRLLQGAIGWTSAVLDYAPIQALVHRVDALLQEPTDPTGSLPEQILLRLFRHRRLQTQDRCATHPCPQCLALHLPRVERLVERNEPIQLVLPAFPAKSPNLRKVLGSRPDTAESLALRSLDRLCQEIAEIYPPGARLTVCSDGHVFSDLVGVPDTVVTAYNAELRAEMADTPNLRFFNLQDIYPDPDYPRLRAELLPQSSEPLSQIRERVHQHPTHRHLFDGLHRFLFEDHAATHPDLSRSRARQETKARTYEVIQRSNAWGRLVSLYFPDALRLSIHPQAAHSDKIGVLLTPAVDNWITPWHGVALLRDQDFLLLKRSEAEQMGARLCYRDGRPVHFVL